MMPVALGRVRNPYELTRREVEVLCCFAMGLRCSEVASRLRIDNRTVHFHLQNAYGKLEVHDRYAALRRAGLAGMSDEELLAISLLGEIKL